MYGHERLLVEKMSGRPFVLLGVNNDAKLDTVKTAIKDNKLNWRSWWDGNDGPIVDDFGITGFPTIFFIDHTGVIRFKNLRGETLDAAVETLVSAAEAEGMVGGSEPSPKFREFVDVSGKHRTMAAYVEFDSGKVVLKKEDESEVKVPFQLLSEEDRRFVAKLRLKSEGRSRASRMAEYFNFANLYEFRDSSGKNSIKGTYIALENGQAVIWKEDGTEISVSMRQLSEETKKFIHSEIKKYKGDE